VRRSQELAAVALASCSLLLALAAASPLLPGELLADAFAPKALPWLVATVVGGAAIALALGRTLPGTAAPEARARLATHLRRATVALGRGFERGDAFLRRWHVAGVSLVALALALGFAMRAG
jgi:hypothetical protein